MTNNLRILERDGTPISPATARLRLTTDGRWPNRPADLSQEDAECDYLVLIAFQDRPAAEFKKYIAG